MDYFDFKGQRYYPGTKVKIRYLSNQSCIMTFRNRHNEYLTFTACTGYTFPARNVESHVLEILEVPKIEDGYYTNRRRPPTWQVEMGITWYVIIMVVLALFKERWMGWVCITAYFVLWISGFLNGGKK